MLRAMILSLMIAVPGLVVAQELADRPAAERLAYDYTAMYDALNPAIVKVLADGATGSGFLVTSSGLVATNHHVVHNSRYLAVQFSDGRKLLADAVILDPRHDVAILKVNRDTVVSVKPLALLPDSRDRDVRAGMPVVAFGSPLSQTFLMTQGIVSKVEANILLGDFLIQPGNSGGPLVNLKGEVVGINTFAEGGISGAVRVNALKAILESAAVTGYDRPDPPADPLPVLAPAKYSPDALKKKLLEEPLDRAAYTLDAGKFTITAITPVLIGKTQVQTDLMQAKNRIERRGKKAADATWREIDGPFYEWMRDASSLLEYAVTFEIKPDFGATAGSKWAAALSGVAAGLSRTPLQPVHQTMEFKAEFQDFRLYRDGTLIKPVHPGRAVTEASFQAPLVSFVDEAYSGTYTYSPEVFATGNQFRLDVFDAREPGRVHRSIVLDANSRLIKQIRSDLAALAER